MNLSYKNRIALHYMIVTTIIMAVAFVVVYFVVKGVVYRNIDGDLSYEAEKHIDEIKIVGDSIKIKNKKEWEEREHREAQVNPVFIQILDKNGAFMDRSPNLKENKLKFKTKATFGGSFNEHLNDRAIRQIQLRIEQDGILKGYIIAAMSFESSKMVLVYLRNILLVVYLVLLASLYFISKYIAGRSIKPVKLVTDTTSRITKNNLNERVPLPPNKDELFDLSTEINALLQRIENAIERERQFTSDASHELRTPLATLRGTLEVLLRKPREPSEYEEKIIFSLGEINRMTETIEQLLLLARFDSDTKIPSDISVSLATLIDEIISRYKEEITAKDLIVNFRNDLAVEPMVSEYYARLIIGNVFGNAVKYAKERTTIYVHLKRVDTKVICTIKDQGIGIKKEDLNMIFNHFFRSNALEHKNIVGNGLGLSIAKKAADAINATIRVESKYGVSTTFIIKF
ncbi:ATP-binding protein [Flavobacteriaceae bacterium F08102]|nr:ATP-binding protein [Flavobacteriaceae bacterium F08102]